LKLITRDTDYAIRSLCFIARSRLKVVPVSELVKNLKIPRPFLRKTLQKLNKLGFLRSFKGRGGGFSLGYSLNTISLFDLINAFQGPVVLNKCIFNKKTCPEIKRCPLKKRIDNLERDLIYKLKSVTIKHLLEKGRRNKWLKER